MTARLRRTVSTGREAFIALGHAWISLCWFKAPFNRTRAICTVGWGYRSRVIL